MSDLISLDIYYLTYFFLAIFAASFAVPTGALITIVSFASVASGLSDMFLLFVLSLTATISGDYSAYLVAKIFKKSLDQRISKSPFLKRKALVVDKTLESYGSYTVFLTRFLVSGIGPYVNIFSGLRGFPRWIFLKAVISGELIYVLMYLAVGYFFRDTWQEAILLVKDYAILTALVLIGCYMVYRLIKVKLKNRSSKKEKTSDS